MIATAFRPKLCNTVGRPNFISGHLSPWPAVANLVSWILSPGSLQPTGSACKGMIYRLPLKILCPTFATAIFSRENQMSPLFSFTSIQQQNNKCMVQPFLGWIFLIPGAGFSSTQTHTTLTKNLQKLFRWRATVTWALSQTPIQPLFLSAATFWLQLLLKFSVPCNLCLWFEKQS